MARKKLPRTPLPPRDGLSASRARTPAAITAFDFVSHLIGTQRHRHPDDNVAAIYERFASGQVLLRDGTVLTPNSLLEPDTDIFFYRRPAPEAPVPYEIDIVFEDDDILVVDKPPFLATMPRAIHITETATVRLRRATGNEELTPAHRLDRMTAGLLLFTKRREVRGAYQELFARREVHKRYEAVAPLLDVEVPTVWRSHIQKQHGEIESYEVPGAEPNAETIVRGVERLSATEEAALFNVHGVPGPLARYSLEPVTGKTHQLRVHMASAGAPILGDPVYPDVLPYTENFSIPMRLKSTELAFIDPLCGEKRHFVADHGVI